MAFNPEPEAVLEAGDVLITLGHRQQLDRLEEMASWNLKRPTWVTGCERSASRLRGASGGFTGGATQHPPCS